MKYLKLVGLLVVALAAFVGTASATSLTSPTGTGPTTYTDHFESEGHVHIDNPIATITCFYTQRSHVQDHGVFRRVKKKVTDPTFSNCTDSWHVTTVSAEADEEIEYTSGYNGDVFSTGLTIEATRFGISCRYTTSNTTFGTFTGGSPATLDISASIPFHSGSIFCGSGATAMTGSLKVSEPISAYVDS
jgi:hypothetical protein